MPDLTPACTTEVIEDPATTVYSAERRGNNSRAYNYAFTNDTDQTLTITFQGCALAGFGARVMDIVDAAGVAITLTLLTGETGYAILTDPWNWLRSKIVPAAPATGDVTIDITEK